MASTISDTATQQYNLLKYFQPLSHSRIQVWKRCKFQFKCKYIDRSEKKEADEQFKTNVGIFIHKVLERALEKGIAFGLNMETIDFDLVWFQESKNCRLTLSEYNKAQEQRYEVEKVLERVVELINNYKLKVHPEKQFNMDFFGAIRNNVKWKHRFFTGSADFVGITEDGSTGIILDYKSYAENNDREEEVKDQIDMYKYLMFKKYPYISRVQTGIAYTPDNKIKLFDMAHRETHLPELETFFSNIVTPFVEITDDLINSMEFEPTKNDYCAFCEYKHKCSLFK